MPPHDVVSAFPLVAALRSELLELKIELTHRLQILEDRLAIDSAVEPAASLNGLANVSVNESALSLNESALSLTETAIELNESASISANKSASRLTDSAVDATGLAEVPAVESAELINVPIYSGTTTPAEPTVSAATLEDESAVAENVSAISSVDGLATPLAESVASSADESVGEPAVEEAVEVALAVGSLPVAASEPSVEEVIAATKPQHLNRQQLGKYFGKSHETIRQWEESGRLAEKGWEVVS